MRRVQVMQFGTMKVDQYLDRYVNEIMKLEHKEITYATEIRSY